MGLTRSELDRIYRNLGRPSPDDKVREKASKLGNVRKEVGGVRFQSSLEARAYRILKLWETAGAISDLRLQPSFTLQEFFKDSTGKSVNPIKYSADFRFYDNTNHVLRYIDAKGFVTKAFSKSMKQMKDKFPDVHIEIWTRDTIKELEGR